MKTSSFPAIEACTVPTSAGVCDPFHITHQAVASGQLATSLVWCACMTQRRVSLALCRKSLILIKLPHPTKLCMSVDDFFNRFGIPNCPLGIDGTHIRLENAPVQADLPAGVHPRGFWCRKQFFSINVQVIRDSRHLIRNLGAKWAGCTHDAQVWQNSQAKAPLETPQDTIQTVLQDIKSSKLPRLILASLTEPQNASSYCQLTDTNESGSAVSKYA